MRWSRVRPSRGAESREGGKYEIMKAKASIWIVFQEWYITGILWKGKWHNPTYVSLGQNHSGCCVETWLWGKVGGTQASYDIEYVQLRNHAGHRGSEKSQFLIHYKTKAVGFADGLDVRMIGGKRKQW